MAEFGTPRSISVWDVTANRLTRIKLSDTDAGNVLSLYQIRATELHVPAAGTLTLCDSSGASIGSIASDGTMSFGKSGKTVSFPGAISVTGTISGDGSLLTNLPAAGGGLVAANNLSDVQSTATSRINLGLGSAATLTAGTGANNAVQFDGTGKYPAADGSAITGLYGADDSWGTVWTPAAGTPATNTNWSGGAPAYPTECLAVGAGAWAATSEVFGGVTCWKYVPTSASARQGLQITPAQTLVRGFEMRVRIYMPAAPCMVRVATASTAGGGANGQLLFSPAATGISYAGPTVIGVGPDLRNVWTTWTFRFIPSAAGADTSAKGSYMIQVWAGEYLLGTVQGASMTDAASIQHVLGFERNSGTATTPFYLAYAAIRDGLNERLPSATFRGKGVDQ